MRQSAIAVSVAAKKAACDLKVLVSRLHRQLKEVAATDELTASQVSVLARLSVIGESSMSELAGAERIRQVIALTATGRDRARGAGVMREEWLAEALQERCTEAERATITEALALLEGLLIS